MKRGINAVAAFSVSAALMLGLSACAAPHESIVQEGFDDLSTRGFEDVKFVEKSGRWGKLLVYNVKLDNCSIDVSRSIGTGEANLVAEDYDMTTAIREKHGGVADDIVHPVLLRKYANEVGLADCLKL